MNWIKFSENKPPAYEKVIVSDGYDFYSSTYIGSKSIEWDDDIYSPEEPFQYIYWAIPELPKNEITITKKDNINIIEEINSYFWPVNIQKRKK